MPRSILKVNFNTAELSSNEYFKLDEKKNSNLINYNSINNLLENSVKMNLLSDTKIGTFLSGGVDSSLVTAIAKKYNNKIEGFTTIYLPEKKYEKFNQDFFIQKNYLKI